MTNEQEDMLKLFSDFCKQPAGDSGLEIGEYLDEEFMFSLFCEIYRFSTQAIRDQEAAKRVQLEAQIAMLCGIVKMAWHENIPDGLSVEDVADMANDALEDTQPTADAFVARIKAESKLEGKVEALERYANQLLESVTHDDSANHEVEDMKQIIAEHMLGRAADLRKGKERSE